MDLSKSENIVLNVLWNLEKKGVHKVSEADIVNQCKLSPVGVSSAVSWLEFKKLINLEREEFSEYYVTTEGKEYIHIDLPEARLLKLLKERKKISVREVMDLLSSLTSLYHFRKFP